MTQIFDHYDVAVIGAGIAGLACAQKLAQTGQRVVVLEKSRGVGGRVATRRLQGTRADHGACYLLPRSDRFRSVLEQWMREGVLQVWTDTVHEIGADGVLHSPPEEERDRRYIAPQGMTAIAKSLAAGLEIQLSHRVVSLALTPDGEHWHISTELTATSASNAASAEFLADAVIVAIPAPQALTLLQPLTAILSSEFMTQLESVQFLPCISAIAGYSVTCGEDWVRRYPDLKAVTFSADTKLGWLGLDSSKRSESTQPVVVIQSTAEFANSYLNVSDLQPVGQQLFDAAAEKIAPWLSTPEWLQVHRWRYAFAATPLKQAYITAGTSAPLICTGDWCSGRKVEEAYFAGLTTAEHLIQRSLSNKNSPGL